VYLAALPNETSKPITTALDQSLHPSPSQPVESNPLKAKQVENTLLPLAIGGSQIPNKVSS
jgi:hypothetical protein